MKNIIKKWFALPLWAKILICLILGMATGLIFGTKATCLEPIGNIFIRSIQMLVAPVVTVSVIYSVISMQDMTAMRRVIIKAIALYGISMLVAASCGVIMANFLHVGQGIGFGHVVAAQPIKQTAFSLSMMLTAIVPSSAVQAWADNNVLQILFFSFLFGLAIRKLGRESSEVQTLVLSLSKIIFELCKMVISFAPYGVFAFIATVFGRYGLAALLPLLKFICAVYLGCALLIFAYYALVLKLLGMSPIAFFKGIMNAILTAYTTSSSAATLPVTLRCARENLKIDSSIADFLIPLGTSLNLNGLAIYLAAATIFSANFFGVHLDLAHYFLLVFSIALMAAGAAAIPGSALIVMGAVMQSVGVPIGVIPLIAGVDRFNDMAQTCTNVIGDLFVAKLVAKSEEKTSVSDSQAEAVA